jgi:release factor glutamine methyltransferase
MKPNSSLKSSEWLARATKTLRGHHISSAHLDALILLEDCLGKDRSFLLAHPELELSPSQLRALNKQLIARQRHTPLAYIRKRTEFYGRDFYIDERVLEPRPETETMITLYAELGLPKKSVVADVGSGSGCIGITLALEFPELTVDMYEIELPAIEVSKKNAELYKVDVHHYQSDLLSAWQQKYDVILANLPYVPDHFTLNSAAEAEPRIAIFGGHDGLDIYRQLFTQIQSFDWRPQFMLTESLPPQHDTLTKIAASAKYQLIKTDYFIQCFSRF